LRRPIESAQDTSEDYTQQLDDAKVLASVGSVGDCYDNALAESFVDSYKTELIADRVWRTTAQLERATVDYVSWFNHRRLHTSIGNRPPIEHEREYWARVALGVRNAPGTVPEQTVGSPAASSQKRSPGDADRELAAEGNEQPSGVRKLARVANGLGVAAASAGEVSRTDHPDVRRGIHAAGSDGGARPTAQANTDPAWSFTTVASPTDGSKNPELTDIMNCSTTHHSPSNPGKSTGPSAA